MSKLEAKTRRKLNRSLGKLGLRFHETPGLALAAVLNALQTEGLSFGLTYQPKTGTTRNTVLRGEAELSNSLLVVQTHEMEVTGRVELNCYLS
jgi:hypothetical protein